MKYDYIDRFENSWKWPGLYYYWLTYKGERYLLKKLLHWWKSETGYDLPEWVYSEDDSLYYKEFGLKET